MKHKIKLGLIGLGTVGSKVLDLIFKNKDLIERKIGALIEFSYICDRYKNRFNLINKMFYKNVRFTTDYQEVINSSDVDIVIELIGGRNVAKKIILESLEKNKHVVTANKAVLAENWDEIFSLARRKQKLVYFEASVGAGIPIIQALNEGLAANNISTIIGILNGTCNYILTKMTTEHVSFDLALKEAQRKGFAETNPVFDIRGIDTLHKLVILSSIAWGSKIDIGTVYCEGISNLKIDDIIFAYDEFDYVIKLLGIARRVNNELELQVRPCLISKKHPFSSVENEYNAILLNGDACGEIIFYGKGAGGYPAASAVVSDIIFLSRQVAIDTAGRIPYVNYDPDSKQDYLDINDTYGCYYVRFTTVDKPGVLSQISGILGKHKVSIASVYQKEQLSRYRRGVPILMLTHLTREGAIRNAINEIDKLSIVKSKTVLLKIIF